MRPASHLLAFGAGIPLGFLCGRRFERRGLNEALHELRRPLQAMALVSGSKGGEQWLEQARAALAGLDRRLNGEAAGGRERSSSGIELIDEARRRWTAIGGAVELSGSGPATPLAVDSVAVGSALDNLIANALEHGRGPVRLRVAEAPGAVKLQVENEGELAVRDRGDPRRGHGLRIAARIAARQGGRLSGPSTFAGTVAAGLELPVAAER